MTSEEKKPREFWIRIPTGLFVNAEHFITNVMTKQTDGYDLHTVEFSALELARKEIAKLRAALEQSLRQWEYHMGREPEFDNPEDVETQIMKDYKSLLQESSGEE